MPIKINGTNTAANPSITGDDTDTGIVYGSDQIDFSTGGTSKVTLNGSNLGLGTTSPQQLLHVFPDVANTSSSYVRVTAGDRSNNTGLDLGHDSSGNCHVNAVSNAHLILSSNNSERLRVGNTGNVGIGTTTPVGKFDVTDGTTSISFNKTNNTPRIDFKGNNVSDLCQIKAAESSGGGVLQLFTKTTGGTATKRMVLDSSGNLNFSMEAASGYPTQQIKWSNDSTTTNGFYIAQHSDRNGRIWHEQGLDIDFGTTNTQRMRIDSSGNLLLGASSYGGGGSSPKFYVSTTSDRGVKIHNTNSATSSVQITNAATGQGDDNGLQIAMLSNSDALISNVESAALRFSTTSTERVRISSAGSLLVGCTSTPSASVTGTAFITESSGRRTGFMSSSSTSEMFLFQFFNPNGGVGSIRTNGSATSFETSSDYRLKENATAISDGITRLKTLKPYRFNFKADADTTLDGFFAHEVQSVVPEAISGTKDETKDILYTEDDTIPSGKKIGDVKQVDPVYQGIDQSKLVPLLTAALQEAIAKIEVLETKVAVLEAA